MSNKQSIISATMAIKQSIHRRTKQRKIKHLHFLTAVVLLLAGFVSSCKKDFEENTPDASTAAKSARLNGTISPANSMIYLVQNGSLYAVNASDFQDFTKLGNNWYGTAQTIASDGASIYAVQSGHIWQTNRFTGEYKQFGNGNWHGSLGVTGVAGFADEQGNMFAQAGDYLWRIDLFGVHHKLGEAGWSGTKALFYHRGNLYVVWKNGYLYKVNSKNGTWQELTGGWGNVNAIAAPYSTGDRIYIIENGNLWEVNTNTNIKPRGDVKYLKSGFTNTKAMTGVNGHLYVASNNCLHKVDLTGKKVMTNLHYGGITAMGSVKGTFN